MQVTFRPLPAWPHKPTVNREPSRFDTPYPKTLALLEREIGYLGGRDVVMGVGLSEHDIRLDGQPRANARAFGHPGVEISFNSREHGRLSYSSDQYLDWPDNVRAIALSLEALRAVERWGVSKGRQYAGFTLLTAGPGKEERGRQLVAQHGSVTAALRATHPDTGGVAASPADFDAVMAIKRAEAPA